MLFKYKLTINLSEGTNIAVVARPSAFTSTGVVLFVSQPKGSIPDVNNNVVVPPEVYFDTVK